MYVVELAEVFLEEGAGGVKEPVHLSAEGPTGEPMMRCDDRELDRVSQCVLRLKRVGLELTKSKI